MASKAQAKPKLENTLQKQINKTVQEHTQEPGLASPTPSVQAATSSPVIRTFDTFQSAQQVDQTLPAVPGPLSLQNQEKLYGSVLNNTFILHRLPEGQVLLTVRPTLYLAVVVAGAIGVGVALIALKKILTRKQHPNGRRFKIKRIDL